MFDSRKMVAAPLLALLLGTSSAAALTADEVWAAWQAGAAATGLTLTGTEGPRGGGEVSRSGVTLGRDGLVADLGTVVFREPGDGSVEVVLAEEMMISWPDQPEGSEASIRQEGLRIVLRDGQAPGSMAWDVAADLLDGGFAFNDGSEAEGDMVDIGFSVVFEGMTALYASALGADGATQGAMELTAQALSYEVNNTNQAIDSISAQTSSSENVVINLLTTLPAGVDLFGLVTPQAIGAALRAGMKAELAFEQGETVQTDVTEDFFSSYELEISTRPGKSTMTLDRAGIGFAGFVDGGDAAITLTDMGLPKIDLAFGAFAMGFQFPLIADKPVDDFSLSLAIDALTVSEEAWALVDAAGALPREPAALVLDVKGTASIDVLDLAAADMEGRAPTQPQLLTLDVRDMALAVAGAAMTGTGAFTFDNPPGAAPVPAGKANMTITGANGLLDGLVAAGLVSQDDAGGARMMMGMFLRPGDGDDVLTSEVEANADGSILVNGMRVQ